MGNEYLVVYWDASKSPTNPEGVVRVKTHRTKTLEEARSWLHRIESDSTSAWITRIVETYNKEFVKQEVSGG